MTAAQAHNLPAAQAHNLPPASSTPRAPEPPESNPRTRWLLRTFAAVGVLVVGLAVALAGVGLRAQARSGLAPQLQEVASWDDLARFVTAPPGEYGMVAQVGDTTVTFPALDVDVTVDIEGDVANVTVVQTFENPSAVPVNATYLFPLPSDAAVHAMTMEVGDERIRAQIERIEEATQIFEQAQANGQAAALVVQERPNVFTQRIANLMPGLPVRVELRYVQQVPRVRGLYDLAVPLVVGPRYIPAGTGETSAPNVPTENGIAQPNSTSPANGAELNTPFPNSPIATTEDTQNRVSITVHLNGGTPIRSVRSTTHPMTQDWHGASAMTLALADPEIPDDRDFRLVYALGTDDIAVGTLAHFDERGGYFSLRIDPPEQSEEAEITAREMVFVLDTSGSMSGLPIEASKAFTTRALRNLRPTDTFRVIQFGDTATEFSLRPVPATAGNIERAVEYVEALQGGGGTAMLEGVHQALADTAPDGAIRLVVFLTDGFIGNDVQVLSAIDAELGDARLFGFGVGSGVNEFLLTEMGRRGRGFTRFLALDDDADAAVASLVADLQSPVLTDVEIDWGGIVVSDTYPARIPDVFAGRPISLAGRFAAPQSGDITVRGNIAGVPTAFTVAVDLPADARGEAVPLLWAQRAIDEGMAELTRARWESGDETAIKERVIQLGLDHALVTRWTAFVAVSERIVNENPGATAEAAVPVSNVHGTSLQANGGAFAGSSAPEPFTWLALLTAGLSAGAAGGSKRRRRRAAEA